MPHYVTLMRWTSQGRMGLPAWRDRVDEGERTIEDGWRLGCVGATCDTANVPAMTDLVGPKG